MPRMIHRRHSCRCYSAVLPILLPLLLRYTADTAAATSATPLPQLPLHPLHNRQAQRSRQLHYTATNMATTAATLHHERDNASTEYADVIVAAEARSGQLDAPDGTSLAGTRILPICRGTL